MQNILLKAIIDDELYNKVKNIKSGYIRNKAIAYVLNCYYYNIDIENINDYINIFYFYDKKENNIFVNSLVPKEIISFMFNASNLLNANISITVNLLYTIYYDLENVIRFLENRKENIFNYYSENYRINFIDDYREYIRNSDNKCSYIFRIKKNIMSENYYLIKTKSIDDIFKSKKISCYYLPILFNMLHYQDIYKNEKNKKILYELILKYAIL